LNRALAFLFFTVFIDLLGVGILVPVMPYIVRKYNGDALTVGLMATAFSAAQFLAGPVLGIWSDRAGRRPVLLISLFGTGIGYFLFGIGGSLAVLYLSRLIDGITGGNISTAQAYIADCSEPKDRAKNFGLIGAAFGLGFILGPAIGGLLSHITLEAPAFAAGGLALANTLFGFFALPESLPKEKRRQAVWHPRDLDPILPMLNYVKRKPLTLLFGAIFLFNFAFSGLTTNFALYTLERFHWGPPENAWIFAFLGVISTVVQGWLVRRLVPLWGEEKMALAGPLLTAAGFVLIAAARSPWWLYAGIAGTAVGSGISTPAWTGLLSRRVDASEQGTLMGVNQSVSSLTRILGPIWAGLWFDYAGPVWPYWTGALFIVAAYVMVRGAVGSWRQQ
jgi:MFS transporter, DHA1 family, tetracycline resistance protein